MEFGCRSTAATMTLKAMGSVPRWGAIRSGREWSVVIEPPLSHVDLPQHSMLRPPAACCRELHHANMRGRKLDLSKQGSGAVVRVCLSLPSRQGGNRSAGALDRFMRVSILGELIAEIAVPIA